MEPLKSPCILFVVEKPPVDEHTRKESTEWLTFSVNLKDTQSWLYPASKDHESKLRKLAENVWLIPLKDGFQALGHLVVAAKIAKLHWKFLAFDEEPQWICSDDTPRRSADT